MEGAEVEVWVADAQVATGSLEVAIEGGLWVEEAMGAVAREMANRVGETLEKATMVAVAKGLAHVVEVETAQEGSEVAVRAAVATVVVGKASAEQEAAVMAMVPVVAMMVEEKSVKEREALEEAAKVRVVAAMEVVSLAKEESMGLAQEEVVEMVRAWPVVVARGAVVTEGVMKALAKQEEVVMATALTAVATAEATGVQEEAA